MAYAETKRNNVKYYGVSLSTWVENISDSTARIHWTAAVDFGNWYYYGVRLHVKVGGVWRASGDGYTTYSGARAVTVSGYTDAARKDDDYGVWVEAYTESVSVGGYGGVGSVTSCGESAGIPKIPAYKPDAPTDLVVTESTDGSTALEWVNHPDDGARKYYEGVNVYRHTDDGPTENPYNQGTISNWRDATTSANRFYDYDVRARWRGGISEMSNKVRVFKTPAPPASVSLARSGDGEVSLVVRGPDIPWWISGFKVRATSDGGKTYISRSLAADKQEPGVWSMTDPAAVAGERVVYEVCTYRDKPVADAGDTICSAWTASNAVATICPPYAPTVSGLDPAYPTGTTATVSWSRSHPDGTAQTAAQVELVKPGGASAVVDIAGAASTASVALADKGTYRLRVRTKGSDPSWGAWSQYSSFTVADPPQAFFTTPAEDGDAVVELPLDIAWEAADETGIASQRLRIISASASVLDADVGASARTYSVATGLSNETLYTLELTVRGGSGLAATFTRTFATEWLVPAAPIVSVAYSYDYSATVTVRDGVSEYAVDGHRLRGPMALTESGNIRFTGGVAIRGTKAVLHDLPPCQSFDVIRVLPDGSRRTLATGLKQGQSVIDRLPPLNAAFAYVAVGHAASGTVSTTEVETSCACRGYAFNFDAGATTVVAGTVGVGGPPVYSRSYDHDVVQYHFFGSPGGLPMGFTSRKLNVPENWEFGVRAEDIERVSALFLANSHCWARTHDGERAFVSLSPNITRSSPGWYRVSLTTKREVWREPNA